MPPMSSDLAQRLGCVAIPPGLRGFETEPAASSADQAFSVTLDGASISGIVPVSGRPTGTLLSGFVALHVHLDKTYTVSTLKTFTARRGATGIGPLKVS